jgi:hypothetical protein
MAEFTHTFVQSDTTTVQDKEAVPVKGRGGPQGSGRRGCPMFCTVTDGGEVVSLLPQEVSRYSFLLETGSAEGP